ncbi:bacteriophage T4 gp5 trimerisation domain-containing protein [Psychrobacter faecalis]
MMILPSAFITSNETIDIGGNRDETVHKSEQILIKGNRDKNINGNDTLTVNKNRKETINKSRSLNVDKNNTEMVKMAKSVTVGLAYATQVGTIMNTAVGIMQTEQIGRIKKSFVGKSYSITAGDEFKITVGKSSLVMNADGSIIITGSTIITQAEKENKVIGKDVLINPPGASSNGGIPDDYDYEEGSVIPGTNTTVGEPVEGGGGEPWYNGVDIAMGIKSLNLFSKDSEYKFGMNDKEWEELKNKNVVEYELAKQYAKDNINMDMLPDQLKGAITDPVANDRALMNHTQHYLKFADYLNDNLNKPMADATVGHYSTTGFGAPTTAAAGALANKGMFDTVGIGKAQIELIQNGRKPLFINEDRFKQVYGRGYDKDIVKIHADKKKVRRDKK